MAALDVGFQPLSAWLEPKTRSVIGTHGEEHTAHELTRHPACSPPSGEVLRDRVERATAALLARAPASERRSLREARKRAGVGCEEDGRLLVTLRVEDVGIGVREAWGTFLVDSRSAAFVADGEAIAHVDLDGDGRRDLVLIRAVPWSGQPGEVQQRCVVRFSGSGRISETPLKWSPYKDMSQGSETAVSPSPFALVRTSGRSVLERLRWDGKRFAVVERLDDEFERDVAHSETRVELSGLLEELDLSTCIYPRDPAPDDPPHVRSQLGSALGKVVDPATCFRGFEEWIQKLARAGLPEAEGRPLLRTYLGWRPCR